MGAVPAAAGELNPLRNILRWAVMLFLRIGR